MRYFLSYFKPHRKLFFADLLCAAFIAAADLSFPMLTRYSINNFLGTSDFRSFYIFIASMVALYAVRTGAQYFVTYFGHLFGARVETDMRRDIFAHIEKQSFSFFDGTRTGQLMSRITNDLFEITELAHHGPEDLFIAFLTITGSLILMLTIRWELVAILAIFLPIVILHTALSRKNLMAASKNVKERIAEINTATESSISGIRVTQIFTNEEYEKARFEKNNRCYYAAKRGFYRAMAFFHCRLDFFTSILNVIIIAVGGYLIMQAKMNLTDLITATLFSAAFLQPIRRLTAFVEHYVTGMAGFKRFTEIMRTSEEIKDKPNAVRIDSAKGDIEYENIGFAYNNGITVLNNVNLSIKAGQTIAFVGTIRENIAYGKTGATDEEIIEAARRAEIHDDIIKTDKGYDTLVGERGIRLSGGQKQRIAIARIFLKNPPILILDEATSALDTATEIKIQKSFERLAKGRTTLIIAHRLSTIRSADLIAVVNDEGICEQGTHRSLLARNGLYASLYNAQKDLLG